MYLPARSNLMVRALACALVVAACSWTIALGHGNNPKPSPAMTVVWGDVVLDEASVALFEMFAALGYDFASPLQQCAETAVLTCGEGKVCCVKVEAGGTSQSCTFCCHDGNGECDHCGICWPPASDD